jgi:sterol desaturase/sphingolipid hydroxylase (fatty acid hydroxylase superfamily)
MNLPDAALLSGICVLSFAYLLLVFRPLEMVFPASAGQRLLRPQWSTDLGYFVGQYLFFNGLEFGLLVAASRWLDVHGPVAPRVALAGLPWWLQAVLVILASDLLLYWGHRLQHRWDFLWRFHAVHHTAEHLDWLAAHREHPVDMLYTATMVNLPPFLLGFPIETIGPLIAFRGMWAIFIHSNVRLPIGPLRVLIGAPELHHWHHARDRDTGNYANLSPLMDLLFGTYHCPGMEPERFGIEEPAPATYLGQLLWPFRRRWE